ncbi:MAG: multiheme c-type cytochrome [Campylobacterota bacterium]|nr:multiheme c-type cytochrome [Campylobacterota bacterium]
MRSLILFFTLGVLALNASGSFEQSRVCQKCHPVIFDEFYTSSHRNASIYNDPIHKAVWDKHPLKAKEKYSCAECHTPSDLELLKKLEAGESALPEENRAQTEEGISCVSCHTIERIEEHAKANKNIMSTKEKVLFSAREGKESEKDVAFNITSSWFGMVTEKSGSPYHKIDFSNNDYYDGKMCMGCHSHKQNAHGFEVCRTDVKAEAVDEQTCIGCHMPMIKGSMNTVNETPTHRYHGFPGAHDKPKMLSKYVKLDLKRTDAGFVVSVKNEANHPLFLHPLRLSQLKVSIKREGKSIDLEAVSFARVIGKDGKPAMPWIADSVVKDTQIQAGENREVSFTYALKKGDTVEARMGFYRVNPKAAEKLQLRKNKALSSFTLLKKELFQIEQ